MSKQRIDEMKKFMQIAEGNVAEAKVDPKLKKAAKLMQQVVDGLGAEWEDTLNGADPNDPIDQAEAKEFAEHIEDDQEDYKKIVKMLLNGRGKAAAKFYDGLDTVAREYIYDHIENDDITFLQKVFDKLGSNWLFMDEYFEEGSDPDDTDWDAHWAREDGDEERADDLEWDAEWERMDEDDVCEKCGREGCKCGPDCDCKPVDEDKFPKWPDDTPEDKFRRMARLWGDDREFKDKFSDEELEQMIQAQNLDDWQKFRDKFGRYNSPEDEHIYGNPFEDLEEELDPDGMGYYNVTIQHEDNYPDEVETALPYDEAMQAAHDLVERLKRGRWEVKKWKMKDAYEWQMLTGDEESVTVRVEPTDDADAEAWHGIGLGEIAESVLGEDNAAFTGKSKIVKNVAAEKGIDVVDLPMSDPDEIKGTDIEKDYPEVEDEELGLRFD